MRFPALRLRRLRQDPVLQDLVRETHLHLNQFIMPLFITAFETRALPSMPGLFQISLKDLEKEIHELLSLNIKAILIFGIPESKDPIGESAWQKTGIMQKAVAIIKKMAPDMLVIADLCFCEYTDHGHCGVISKNKHIAIDNDATLANLNKQALSLVEAGVDIIAPSGMIDGMVQSIRQALDANQYQNIPILSYSVKYASSYYAAFRDAVDCQLSQGQNRKAYQMDYHNRLEAIREVALDLEEGADMIMVKPAGLYLDIIREVKNAYPAVPLSAYQIGGEYSQIKAAAHLGFLNEQAAIIESLVAIKRAGADFIISYFTKQIAKEKLL